MIKDPITLDASEPQKFAEAVAYFRKQAPWISGSSWATMARLSAQKGDTVSGATLLSMVDDVWKRMDAAVADGEPYSEFVRKIGKSFRMDWAGLDSPRLKLIYHNNVGSALMAGRMDQITDPDVVSDRPYILFDAIEDMRTTQICLDRDGIIRPATDPWWKKNTPLLHHNCRSSVISLDGDDMHDEGGLTRPDKLAKLSIVPKGWGSIESWENWKPEGTDYHPVLFREYENWRDGGAYARDLDAWHDKLARSWGEGLNLDNTDLEKVLDLPESEPKQRVVEVAKKVRPEKTYKTTEKIREVLDTWVVGSRRKMSVLAKTAAIEEFGLPGIAYSRTEFVISDKDVADTRPVVRQVYEDTQDSLVGKQGQTIKLYRGYRTARGGVTARVPGALESWTSDRSIAEKFAAMRDANGNNVPGEIVEADVPVTSIFAYSGGPHWKNGKFGEQAEYIVLSNWRKWD